MYLIIQIFTIKRWSLNGIFNMNNNDNLNFKGTKICFKVNMNTYTSLLTKELTFRIVFNKINNNFGKNFLSITTSNCKSNLVFKDSNGWS